MPKAQGIWKHDEVALVLIDYQEEMFENIRSETSADQIELNLRLLIMAAKAFEVPIVLSTVGVEMGVNRPTRQSIIAELPGTAVIDRSSMNAWEDQAFRTAIEKTGRRRLIFGALYTEICLAFPTVHAIADGYDVGFVADAVGGLSQLAHRTAIDRLVQAGGVPHTSLALVTEFFRDWKSELAGRGREIIKWYLAEAPKLAARRA